MSPRSTPLICALTLTLLAGCAPSPKAGLVLTGGKIYTVDPDRSVHQAVAIRDGKILFVGDDAGARALAGPDTRVVDLGGRLVLPGLQDAHVHPVSGGVEASLCDLNGLSTVDQYLETIAAYAEANPEVEWITGGGWLMSAFGPGAMPRKELLDAILPERPVLVSSSDGHSAWANSRALELAGITPETPDPADGRIDRDPQTGELIGSLQEGAIALLDHVIPPLTDQQREDGLRYSVAMFNRYGITGVQEASAGEADLRAYRALDEAGELTVHAEVSQKWQRDQGLDQLQKMIALREQYSTGQIRTNTVKIFQDGVMENYTAVMLEPYDLPGNTPVTGIPMVEPEFLKEAVTAMDAAGFQVHIHAIGDGAIRQSLDAVQAARKANGPGDNRHHLSHIELIDPADIPRFGELDVIANFQPLWAYADEYITDLTLPFIGEQRGRWIYPIASVIAEGGMVAFGSDWSVSTANPWPQIEVAVTRKDPDDDAGEAFIPQERISLEEAIAAFTINAAYTNHRDSDTGSIEVGKLADLVILDQDLFSVPAERISETRAVLTLFEGHPVHGKFEDL